MIFQVGHKLMISNLEAHVIGWIEYKNTEDGDKRWREYRLKTKFGERWLSVDDVYQEYSLSWADNSIRGQVGPEWHQVDKGHQVVTAYGGDVDVESGDAADFIEFEDASENNTLSVEIWDDGTEFSKGVYLDATDIRIVGYEKPPMSASAKYAIGIFAFVLVFWFLGIAGVIIMQLPKQVSSFVSRS